MVHATLGIRAAAEKPAGGGHGGLDGAKLDTSIYRIWAKVGVWGHRDGRPTVLKVAGGARGRGAELVR
jgi:hypothetical protein